MEIVLILFINLLIIFVKMLAWQLQINHKKGNDMSEQEVPFSFEELFFSRTDSRGIIISGNEVFQRISLYDWEEIIKRPHNLIRHPDMPKGVFYLFWEFLKRGEPIGAYVKNRAKDGRHYWVFAIATPIEGGFLSVRIKPSSDIFPIVENEYRNLIQQEINSKLTPKESSELLLERLKTLGFKSYQEFMSVAVNKEMLARDIALGKSKDRLLGSFEHLMQSAQTMLAETSNIFSSYEESKYVPLNLQIQSAQLGANGRTIGVISGNYNIVSTEIKNEINDFNAGAEEVFRKIHEGQFLASTARIQREVIECFKQEGTSEYVNKVQEMQYLQRQQQAYEQKAAIGLASITRQIERFQNNCHRMKMLASSLEVIRVMGKVDAARLSGSNGDLNELINDLSIFQTSISGSLSKISQINHGMRYDTQCAMSQVSG